MSELVSFAQFELSTDFAILQAVQEGGGWNGTFATSFPGVVDMTCGMKDATVEIRFERWSGSPPAASDVWEDEDELPWESLPDAGPVMASGFDLAEGSGLDVRGLAQGRVRVLASGRHRYGWSTWVDDLPPERWLVQFWPDDTAPNPMADPPRRFTPPWPDALPVWVSTGWNSLLGRFAAYPAIQTAFLRNGHPLTRDDVLRTWAVAAAQDPYGEGPPEAWTWTTPIDGPAGDLKPDDASAEQRDLLDVLAAVADVPAVLTADDLWSVMLGVGLIAPAPGHGEEFIATAPTISAWDAIALPPETVLSINDDVQRHHDMGNRNIVSDVDHLVRWAPTDVLAATPSALAARLALKPDQVLRALQGVERNWPILIDPDPAGATTQTTFHIRSVSS